MSNLSETLEVLVQQLTDLDAAPPALLSQEEELQGAAGSDEQPRQTTVRAWLLAILDLG